VLDDDRVLEIEVKQANARSHWIWGAFKMPGRVFDTLRRLWIARGRSDEYFGTLVNAYLADGGEAVGVKAGNAYVDVGTLHGYRNAMRLLADGGDSDARKMSPAVGWPSGRRWEGLEIGTRA
jgi:glucose-1-phosphate thymidylyltransferase